MAARSNTEEYMDTNQIDQNCYNCEYLEELPPKSKCCFHYICRKHPFRIKRFWQADTELLVGCKRWKRK